MHATLMVRGAAVALAFGLSIAGATAQQRPPSVAPAANTGGPRFTAAQMHEGTTMSAAECARFSETVYVTSQGVGVCMRYYLSTIGGQGNEAVVWFSGDKGDLIARAAQDPHGAGEYRDSSNERWRREANIMSNRYRRPAIYFARVGIDGSSGWHGFRRTWFEVEATFLALNAIAVRHGLMRFHLMGQSGGGHLVGSLVGLREDIGCAVPGAGRLAFSRRYVDGQARREVELQHYNPSDNLEGVVQNSRTARILVVTSPTDRVVPTDMQYPFAEAIRRAGGRATQFVVPGRGADGHGVSIFTREAMAGCLAGAGDAAITETLHRVGQFAEANERARGSGERLAFDYAGFVRPFLPEGFARSQVATPPAAMAPASRPSSAPPAVSSRPNVWASASGGASQATPR